MGSPSIVKSPIFNMLFVIGSMQLSKRINWDDPDTLLYARVGYYSAQVLVVIMAYMLMHLIKKRNDTRPLRYVPQASPSLMNPQPATESEPVTTTNVEYDVSQVKQFIQSTMSSILMISAMHWYFKFTQPLVLQSILPVKNLLTHKVALIHLWGDAPEGDLKRPFKSESPFAALLGGAGGNDTTESSSSTDAAPVDDGHAKKE
ncbi:inorganic phosphate transporter Pho88 [Zychaea mexicana]|uniref:inorganic phosphate transporter Pho88 n=1 Tax=Zychaea mexicana TaxID=64656 RepID=UPI0022FE6618|nr:inorganic phosphate transporter Pho88 [Zychaea mexicana]KAI9496877.1 inorganic phosphate transporter Pho88 [Zychaea mexicana]